MDITVRLGEWDFNVTTEVPGPRDYSVFNLYIHSSFNSKTLENDIAMLKLNRPADISLSNICLACRPGQIDYYGMNCQAGGWGKLGQSTGNGLNEKQYFSWTTVSEQQINQ